MEFTENCPATLQFFNFLNKSQPVPYDMATIRGENQILVPLNFRGFRSHVNVYQL